MAAASRSRAPIVAAGAVILLCLGLITWKFWPLRVLLVEVALLLGIVLAFRYWPPMQCWIAGMPGAHRVVFGAMLLAMVAGQFTFSNQRYFPLISWEIFSTAREIDTVPCRQFIAVTESGKKVRLLVEQLFPSIVQFNLPGETDSPTMMRLARALALTYDRQHTPELVERVDLVQLSVKLHPSPAERHSPPACVLLHSYPISVRR